MNNVNYFNLVQETLFEEWNSYTYKQPLKLNSEDLTAGVALLTKITVEAIDKESSIKESESIDKRVSSDTELLSGIINKIKAFVADRAYRFRIACQTGFPFSLLESSCTERALKVVLERSASILTHFMTLESEWMSEAEIGCRFGLPFQRLQMCEIAETCSDLKRMYIKNGNNKAGYYLLWLIKQAAGCTYKMPEKESFDATTVTVVLSQFFADSGYKCLKNVTNFLEILHYRDPSFEESFYEEFFDQKANSIFLNFSLKQLKKIPMVQWPSKESIIINLLETVTPKSKRIVAKVLASSKDIVTSKVGTHILVALKAVTLRDAVPHLYALEELLPNFNYRHIELIFGYVMKKFCEDRSSYNDPDFTRRLCFNVMRKVFLHHTLMIGVYDDPVIIKGKIVPPKLFAYDMHTEKMVWGIPFIPENSALKLGARMHPSSYTLRQVEKFITLQFKGEKNLHFIDAETGEFNYTLKLPEIVKDSPDDLHVSAQGFVYQRTYNGEDGILMGGRIIDKQWNSTFEMKDPGGFFLPLSSHCGFEEGFKKRLTLVGPTGDQVTIQDCMAAIAQGDKLYLIEKDPQFKDKCLLTIRTLKMDREVASAVEKSISLNVPKASFGDLCQNGKVVLFSSQGETSPIFVDLKSQEVTYSKHQFPSYAEKLISASGDLWTWDELSNEVWKVSPNTLTSMGLLKSGRGTSFLHIDKEDHLYFVNM